MLQHAGHETPSRTSSYPDCHAGWISERSGFRFQAQTPQPPACRASGRLRLYLYEAGLPLGVQRRQQRLGVPNLQQRLQQQGLGSMAAVGGRRASEYKMRLHTVMKVAAPAAPRASCSACNCIWQQLQAAAKPSHHVQRDVCNLWIVARTDNAPLEASIPVATKFWSHWLQEADSSTC